MNQGSNYFEKENDEMGLSSIEQARLIEFLRSAKLTDTQICDCLSYVATGVIPEKEDKAEGESK